MLVWRNRQTRLAQTQILIGVGSSPTTSTIYAGQAHMAEQVTYNRQAGRFESSGQHHLKKGCEFFVYR